MKYYKHIKRYAYNIFNLIYTVEYNNTKLLLWELYK